MVATVILAMLTVVLRCNLANRPASAPYVDEMIGMGGVVPGGLIGLGLQWHPKQLFRFEQSSTPINPYATRLYWINDATELDYWVGGLVTGGIAPQFTEDAGPVTKWDSGIHRWLAAHDAWGHLQVGGVQTLEYDSKCCHVEGECEWVACNDTIVSMLHRGRGRGGDAGGVDTGPVAGLYVGSGSSSNSDTDVDGASVRLVDGGVGNTDSGSNGNHGDHANASPIIVPGVFTPDPENSTVLVFLSWTTASATISVGDHVTNRIQIVCTSPTPNSSLALSGGMLHVGSDVQFQVSTYDADGHLYKQRIVNGTGSGSSGSGSSSSSSDNSQHAYYQQHQKGHSLLWLDYRLWFKTVIERLP